MKNMVIITKKTLREFGFILGFGLPLIIGWLIPTLFGHPPRIWTLYIGFPILILSVSFPEFLELPYKIWMKIGFLLGWFNSKLILGAIFIFILLPISIIMKIVGHDPLLSISNKQKSYKINKTNHSVDLRKIF